jgi:hypothetical protein
MLVIAVHPAPASTLGNILGFYDWGGQYITPLAGAIAKIGVLGSHQARIAVSPRYEIDYQQGATCSTAGSLTNLVRQLDIRAALNNPNIDVFMLTAYDFTTFGDCETQLFLEPQFYTPANIQALVQEYSDLTLYLSRAYAHTNKRFIISNWEGDNSVYCGQAYSYATVQSFRDSCDQAYPSLYNGNATPAESLAGLKLWFQYRQQGIADGRARATQLGLTETRVYFAPEFSITRALHDNGFLSVLYDVLPFVTFDSVSYSAYESINTATPGETLTEDLNTIRNTTGADSIILGEIGFAQSAWGYDAVISRTNEVLAAAESWGVSYVFVWNLYDSSATQDYGLYGVDGTPTNLATYYQSLLQSQ